MQKIIESLLTAADNHGEDSGEPDHTVGDLQDMLREAWKLMTVDQRVRFLDSDAVRNVVECGAREEFNEHTLGEDLGECLGEMQRATEAAGYRIFADHGWYTWERGEEAGEDFPDRNDALEDAFRHLNERKANA